MSLRKSVLTILGGLLLVTSATGFAQDRGTKAAEPSTTSLRLTQCALKVSGMVCGGCAGLVEAGLREVQGVEEAKVDWKSGDVKVKYDKKKTNPEKIVAAFNKKNPGFRAQLPQPKKKK
ncbi:MAG: heavy-metal-associated domain-containing protein [Terriglobia bacterium]